MNLEQKKGWMDKNNKIMKELDINESIFKKKKESAKTIIKTKTKEYFQTKMDKDGEKKINHLKQATTWEAGKRRKYMENSPANILARDKDAQGKK